MTVEEIKRFAEKMVAIVDSISESSSEQLGIKENRFYIDTIQFAMYDGRSTGHEHSINMSGTLVLVDEAQVIKYLSEHKYTESEVEQTLEFFYDKHYVSFEYTVGMLDDSVMEFMRTIQAKYEFKFTFILGGTVNVSDEEQVIEIKARLQYADVFRDIYSMVKEVFDYSETDGNNREFESYISTVVRRNAVKGKGYDLIENGIYLPLSEY